MVLHYSDLVPSHHEKPGCSIGFPLTMWVWLWWSQLFNYLMPYPYKYSATTWVDILNCTVMPKVKYWQDFRLAQLMSAVVLYEAPFKTKCHQYFQNLYRTSNIYIEYPIYISDIRVSISDNRVPISDIRVPISNIRVSISDVRYTIPDFS